jgi:hypothetical protein
VIKENDGGANLTRYIVRTFANVTMYTHYNNNMIMKNLKQKQASLKFMIVQSQYPVCWDCRHVYSHPAAV